MRTLLFLLLSSLKWGKLATTGGTMLLSLAVYATIWGWRYAAGFVVLLLLRDALQRHQDRGSARREVRDRQRLRLARRPGHGRERRIGRRRPGNDHYHRLRRAPLARDR